MKRLIPISFLAALLIAGCNETPEKQPETQQQSSAPKAEAMWAAPSLSSLGNSPEDSLVNYGFQLVSNTAYYLGPKGKVAHITNGMNCQNCHLEAGTKVWGNNYSAVAANYPKYRERSGSIETVYKRINDCIQRSLNGKALDTSSREMQALKAYVEWVGKDVPKNTKPNGAGITDVAYLDEAANAEKGKIVYMAKCATCHNKDGMGKVDSATGNYQYPPLWGPHSYTSGAGMYRISRLAGFVQSNMPFGTNYQHPQLSDADAWNVAAFVNSQPRPGYNLSKDWPKLSAKPFDHPFGPYADTFTVKQHKYGPFLPIIAYKNQVKEK
ncbi:MAG TPA: c-type cytochrome [Chitinophagales bacterium]|nr:c-type cytochrome [Chitinophagales bacterium]